MFNEICQEIAALAKDRKFVRNLGVVSAIALASSLSLAAGSISPERMAQEEKLDQFSELMSVGLSIRTQAFFK